MHATSRVNIDVHRRGGLYMFGFDQDGGREDPRLCDTAYLATATSFRAPSLPTAVEKRRASGIFPTAPAFKQCTGRRSGLRPILASRPYVLQRLLTIILVVPLPRRELSTGATLPIAQRAPQA